LVADAVSSLEDGILKAETSIDSGRAGEVLEGLVHESTWAHSEYGA
jgi:anthranilate phosphoribosyltransferase